MRVVQIGEIAKAKGGKRLPKGLRVQDEPTPYRYLRVVDLRDTAVDRSSIRFITREAHEATKRYTIGSDDVYVSIAGTIGRVGRLPADLDGIHLTENAAKITGIDPAVNPSYLGYFLQSALGQEQIRARTVGTSQPKLALFRIEEIEVPVPEIHVQQAVVAVLSALDDLIENNRRRIEILEEMARLLYREWFVHFRYPGHEDVELVDSELGPIPEGWKVSLFSDIVTEVKASVSENEILPGSALVGLEHLPRRSTTLVDWAKAESVGSRRKMFEAGDILFGKIRPYFHKVVDAPINGCSSTDAIIFRPAEYAERALCVASSDEFVAAAVATSNGTKMPRANTELLLRYRIPEPPTRIAAEFEAIAAPMSALRRNLSRQNRVLREARDLLLPRLVSGELDVSELDLDGVLA